MWRVTVGAMLSTGDLITDIIVTNDFWNEGRTAFFSSTIFCLALSFIAQAGLVLYKTDAAVYGRSHGKPLYSFA